MRVHWSRRSGTPTRRVAPLSKRACTCARGARRDFTTSSAPLSRCECAAARTYPITRVHWSCAQCVHVSRVGPRGDFVARAWHFGPLISDPTGSSLSRAGAQARAEDPNLAEWARKFQGDDEDEVPLLPAHLEAHWVVLSCEPWNMIVNLAPYFGLVVVGMWDFKTKRARSGWIGRGGASLWRVRWQKVLRDKFGVKNCMPYEGATGLPSDAGRRKGILVHSKASVHCSTGTVTALPPPPAVSNRPAVQRRSSRRCASCSSMSRRSPCSDAARTIVVSTQSSNCAAGTT